MNDRETHGHIVEHAPPQTQHDAEQACSRHSGTMESCMDMLGYMHHCRHGMTHNKHVPDTATDNMVVECVSI